MTLKGPKQLTSREVYANRWMRLREDQIEFADGSQGIYSVVEKTDYALIVPMHEDRRLQMVEQFRYPVGERFWEFPQGMWESRPDADPQLVAAGELTEETGLVADQLRHIGHQFGSYGLSSQGFHVYVATGLKPGVAKRDNEEQDMLTGAFSLDEIKEMIAEGRIKDAATVSALGLLMMSGALYW